MAGPDASSINSCIMVRLFETIYDYLSGKRWLVTAFLLVFLMGCVLLSTRIHYEEDISKFLPREEQNERYTEVYQSLTKQDKIVVVFASKDTLNVAPSDSIEQAMNFFEETLQEVDSMGVIKDLQVHVDESQMMEVMDFIGENAPYFLQEDDYQRMDSLLQRPDYIAEQMTENKKLLNLPTAGSRMESLRYDPLHLFTAVLGRMQDFRMTSSFEVVNGTVFTHDGRSALAFFSSPYGMSESAQNAALQIMLDSVMQQTEHAYPSLQVSAIGAPLVAAGNARQIKKDSMLAVSLAVVLILIILIVHYRRLSYLWWLGCALLFGWLFALAGMTLFRRVGHHRYSGELPTAFPGSSQRSRGYTSDITRYGTTVADWQYHHGKCLPVSGVARCGSHARLRIVRFPDADRYHPVRLGIPASMCWKRKDSLPIGF